jgi:hypothetical protein
MKKNLKDKTFSEKGSKENIKNSDEDIEKILSKKQLEARRIGLECIKSFNEETSGSNKKYNKYKTFSGGSK